MQVNYIPTPYQAFPSAYKPNSIVHSKNENFNSLDKRVDEFFDTRNNLQKEKFSHKSLIGSFLGVATSVLAFGKKQNPQVKLNSFKHMLKVANLKYGEKELMGVASSGIIGGLVGGLADKDERNKLGKIKEATFQLLNVIYPTTFAALGLKLVQKNPVTNNTAGKLIASATGIGGGILASVKTINMLEDKVFDKTHKHKNKEFKAKDILIYADDCVGTLALAKIPMVNQLPMGTILPCLYSWIGYNVGDKESHN